MYERSGMPPSYRPHATGIPPSGMPFRRPPYPHMVSVSACNTTPSSHSLLTPDAAQFALSFLPDFVRSVYQCADSKCYTESRVPLEVNLFPCKLTERGCRGHSSREKDSSVCCQKLKPGPAPWLASNFIFSSDL